MTLLTASVVQRATALKRNCDGMRRTGLFFVEPFSLVEIVAALTDLEAEVRNRMGD